VLLRSRRTTTLWLQATPQQPGPRKDQPRRHLAKLGRMMYQEREEAADGRHENGTVRSL